MMKHESSDHGASPSTFVFLHVPKTAGTTLFDIFKRSYPEGVTFMTNPRANGFGLDSLMSLDQVERDRIRLVAGHMPFGIHTAFSHNTWYFTFLRDPIERSISDYFFVKKQPPSHSLHRQSNSLSLEEYLEYRASIGRDNVHARLLSGLWDSVPFCPDSNMILEQAKQNLRSHFIMIGLTERFDESLLILKRILKLRNIYYQARNVNGSRPRADTLPRATLETVRYYNRADLALYEYGQELFSEQLASYEPSIVGELRAFRQRNRVFGKITHHYWQWRHVIGRVGAHLGVNCL